MRKVLILLLLMLAPSLAFCAKTYSGPFKEDGTNLPPAAVTKNYTSLVTMNALVTFKNGITVSNNITHTTGTFNGIKATFSGNVTANSFAGPLSGNATTATAWATGRTITLTGDATGVSGAFDGSGNLSFATALATSGVTAGTYGSATIVPQITVDSKGRITSISSSNISASGGAGPSATGNIAFFNTASTVTGNTNLYWDNTNNVLAISTSNPTANVSFQIGTGNVLWTGVYGQGTALGGLSNNNTFAWYSDKASIRAVTSAANNSTYANIGYYSAAFGKALRAKGFASFASGDGILVDGDGSAGFGSGYTISGNKSFGAGDNHTSMAGSYSAIFGSACAIASGRDYSFAAGDHTKINSYNETSFGRYNWSPSTGASTWVNTDILFSIGNGSSATATQNAFMVLKNANTGIGLIGVTPNYALEVSGNISVSNVGGAYMVKLGTNATAGTANLTAGVATVNTTAVAAGDMIHITPQSVLAGVLYISNITGGTSFTITSTNAADTPTVAWWIIKPR